MPSKRERGKQRKAVKNLAAGNGNESITQIVAKVSKGDNKTTTLLGDRFLGFLEESNGISYEQSGILSTVLKFLNRCEDDAFVKVMLDVGGNLKTPRVWIDVLIKAEVQEESCRLQIAQNIGPLVSSMCNDTRRLFFKSNKHWREGIHAIVCLIHNMILKSVNSLDNTKGKKIIDTLLQHEGLLESIVQWRYWEEKYRPDITKELNNNVSDIVELGMSILISLITADTNVEESRERLKTIGTTPIISKEYDSECKISFVVGLIRQTKIEGWEINASTCLQRIITNVGCVDKDVINELIDLGINTRDDKWSAHITVLLNFMILKKYNNERFYSNDTRAAFAIRGGLIELCLTFIERFGLNESFDKEKDITSSSFASIQSILSNIYWIGLHKKTAKAIRSNRCSIVYELQRLEQNTEITSNVNCKELLGITRSILDINGSYCCRCNESLSRTEVKLCNGCGCMSYCSRACQKEDWSNGHKLACCKTFTVEKVGQFQGRIKPMAMPEDERKASNLKELEVNMNMIQLKLFLDHKESILSQVKDLDIPLYDCVVTFNLTECPLEVTTHEYAGFYDTFDLKREFEESRSKENITCIFISDIYDGSFIEGQIPSLEIQRLFPHEWLSKRKAHGK